MPCLPADRQEVTGMGWNSLVIGFLANHRDGTIFGSIRVVYLNSVALIVGKEL